MAAKAKKKGGSFVKQAELLAAASLTGLTPFEIIPYCFYPILMGVSGLLFIFIKKRHGKVLV